MDSTTGKKHWAVRVLRALLIAQVIYLVVFNLALQVPLTQTLINAIKPDKFHVSWDKAWTWYPFRVHAVGVAANGQSRSQQWQFSAPTAAASIAVLPLVLKRVWISDLVATDIDYKQRPRLKPEKNYADLIPFFPEITGREISPAVTTPRKDKRPWHLEIEGISVSGNHSYWIMQFQGQASGSANADLSFETRGGPFSISESQLDLVLEPGYINGDYQMFEHGELKGKLGFLPFVPKENKGIQLLKFLVLDADISIDAKSLAFINLFTRNFNGMTIDGSGQVDGHFRMEQGAVLTGTDLSVDADNLQVNLLDHNIEGKGTVELMSEQPDVLQLAVRYNQLKVVHADDDAPLLTGENLGLNMTGPGTLFQSYEHRADDRNLSFTVQGLEAPDLALFGHYLPEKWPFSLYGGAGYLQGHASLSTTALDIDLSITSKEADVGVREYRFDTNLEAALKLHNASIFSDDTSIAGSYIKLTDSHLSQADGTDAPPWNASFVISDGAFGTLEDEQKQDQERLTDLLQLVGQSEGKELLANLHGFMDFESSVTSLAWIGILLNDAYQTGISGRGELTGTIKLQQGMPAPGTDIEILSDQLAVDILDYRSNGNGRISMRVDDGDNGPDWFLQIMLSDADLLRQNEVQPYIQNVDLNVIAIVEDMSLEKTENNAALRFQILSADVTDMSIFTSYLPADSPLEFTNGTASLAADIVLQREDADGWVKLESNNLELTIDQQSISADLSANILLVDGVPAQMMFDISGSEVNLNDMRVTGDNEQFDQKSWAASLQLVHGQTTWKKPLQLDAEVTIQMADSRPIVAMFENKKERPEWLLNMLTIEDIQGTAKVAIADEQIVIPHAHAISDKMEVGAKGVISETSRNGVVYARYKKLDAVIKLVDGKKNIDVIRARPKYDKYKTAP